MDDKTIVLTLYGTKEAISDLSITLFDTTGGFYEKSKAQEYCSNINDLELKGDNWVYATIIKENQKNKLIKPGHTNFDVLGSLDDLTIQKLLREINEHELAEALKSAKKNVLSAVLRNMSKRSAIMLIETMEYMGQIPLKQAKEAQKKIVEIINHLEDIGDIIIPNAR